MANFRDIYLAKCEADNKQIRAESSIEIGAYLIRQEQIPDLDLNRRRPVKMGLKTSAYFRKDNFKKEFAKK